MDEYKFSDFESSEDEFCFDDGSNILEAPSVDKNYCKLNLKNQKKITNIIIVFCI